MHNAPANSIANAVPVAPPTPAPTTAPHEQVVTVVAPLLQRGDGVYRLRLELHPAELGHVEIDVELRNGVLHANMRPEQAGAAHMLRDALNDLRSRLEAQGVRAGDVTVDGRGPGTTGRDRQADATEPRIGAKAADDASPEEDAPPPQAPTENPQTLLDLRM
jgi:flagellar hook-length control protein FliK